MLEKTIKLAVDQETKKIIDEISQGIEDRILAEPYWTRKFLTEIIEKLDEIVAAKPEWTGTLEDSLLSKVQHESAQIGKEIQKLKVAVGNVIPHLDRTEAAVLEVANVLNAIKITVDMTKGNFRNAISKAETQLQEIKKDTDKMGEATTHNLSQLQTLLTEQRIMIERLVDAIKEQSSQIARCERQLDTLTKPWWKKLLGGLIC